MNRLTRAGAAATAAIGAAAALVGLLNGVPELVDETIPWLGERVRVGPIDPTVWEVAAGALLAVFAAVFGYLLSVAHREIPDPSDHTVTYNGQIVPRAVADAAHGFDGVGRDYVVCKCGWSGSGPDYKEHLRSFGFT